MLNQMPAPTASEDVEPVGASFDTTPRLQQKCSLQTCDLVILPLWLYVVWSQNLAR